MQVTHTCPALSKTIGYLQCTEIVFLYQKHGGQAPAAAEIYDSRAPGEFMVHQELFFQLERIRPHDQAF